MIDKFLAHPSQGGLSAEERLWLVQVIAGTVVSDHRISKAEREYVNALTTLLQSDPPLLAMVHSILKTKESPPISPLEVSPELAHQIFRYILEICASDASLEPEEVEYIHAAGMALKVDLLFMGEFIEFTVNRVRTEFFNKLMQELHPNERHWLATVIIKMVHADGRIDRKEIRYLANVFELLDDNPALMEALRRDPRHFSLYQLPPVYFDQELSERILKYLIEITMSDGDYAPAEMALLQEVAKILEYSESLTPMIESVQGVYQALYPRLD